MAKSILKVDVDDESFKRFVVEFDRYQKAKAAAEKGSLVSPKDLARSEKAMKGQLQNLLARNQATARAAANENASANAISRAARAWEVIHDRSQKYSRTLSGIYSSTKNFAQTLGITALAGIGGGLWGMDRLAMSASAGRRSASGMGVSYGEQQAFGLTYGRLVDAGSFMGGISNARGNISSGAAASLYALGLNPAQGSVGELSGAALDRIRKLTQDTPEHLLGVLPQSYGLGELGLGTEDLRRIKNLSSSEYDEYRRDYTKRRGQLEVNDPALKASQDLAVQLDVAAGKIKSVLITGLADLAPHLSKISDAFSDVVQKILGSQGMKDAISWVAGGLKQFGDYVQNEDFKRDIKEFVAGVASLAGAVAKGLRMLGVLPDPAAGSRGTAMSFDDYRKHFFAAPLNKGMEGNAAKEKTARENYEAYIRQNGLSAPSSAFGGGSPLSGSDNSRMGAFMQGIAATETGGKADPYGTYGIVTKSGDRAHGKYQIMGNNIGPWSKEALGYELTREEFMRSPQSQDAIARFKMEQYLKKYGNYDDVASAWHSGRPLREAQNAKDDLGTGTPDYVRKVNQNVKIVLENNTGGNTVASMNQIAY